jgi:hypothetical protein
MVSFFSKSEICKGKFIISEYKGKCSHENDIAALDVGDNNNLITASIDNVLCFWN